MSMRIWIRKVTSVFALAMVVAGLSLASTTPEALAAGIIVNSTADTTANDSVCTLREAIINANADARTWADCARGSGADTITFNSALSAITLTGDLPQITDDLTINGLKGLANTQTINGADTYRVFDVTAGAFSLRHVHVTHSATTDSGSGLYIGGSSQAIVSNSRFSYNNAGDDGGAIRNDGVLTVTNSAFISNTATVGGAIENNATLVVSGTSFISNTASVAGAIYSSGSTALNVTNSTFQENQTTGSSNSGGAIMSSADVATLDANTFTRNHSKGNGGAVSGEVIVTHSDFISNTADASGGAMCGGGTFSDTTFSGNSAGARGGAVYAYSVLTMTNSGFIANSASGGGALFVSNSTATVTGSNLRNNTASNGGAIGIRDAAVLTLTDSILNGNSGANGGALNTTSSGTGKSPQLTASACTFTDNTAGNQGGVIYHSSGMIALTQSTFRHNHTTGVGWGGAIASYAPLSAADCEFSQNSGGEMGGAIYSSDLITVTATTFDDNQADSGGALAAAGDTTTVSGSTFTDNTADYGGALYHQEGVCTLTNSTLVNNSLSTHGSALYSGDTLTVAHSTISGNDGPEALYRNAGTLTLVNSIIANSTAANCVGTITDGGHNLQYGGTVANSCGAAIETADPQLGPLADNGGSTETMALPPDSPALDYIPGAGGCGVGVTVDQRGISRPQGGQCDVGAYEEEQNSYIFLPVVLKQP